MTHDRAHELLTARHDGELAGADAAALDQHLQGCAECPSFAVGLARLSTLTAALPRATASADLPHRVAAALRTEDAAAIPAGKRTMVRPAAGNAASRRWRRRVLPVIPAFGVALLVALLVVSGPPVPGRFVLRPAAAAEPLTRLRTLYLERVITERTREISLTTIERIWYRAPGDLRVERRDESGNLDLLISRLGRRYEQRPGENPVLTVRLPPSLDAIPEPLSPTVALLGRPAGPGPVVAGRPTTRLELDFGTDERRTVLVDTRGVAVEGVDQSVVLVKSVRVEGALTRTKQVRVVRYDEPIDDERFAIPDGIDPVDEGFAPSADSALALRPTRLPAGFRLVRAGSGPSGEALLYARGAFPVLIREGSPPLDLDPGTFRTQGVPVGSGTGSVTVALYDLPRLILTVRGRLVTISAPLPPSELSALAVALYELE